MDEQEVIVACDLGSSKIVTAVGLKKESRIEIIGIGESPSTGIERGLISNIDKTRQAIEISASNAFSMASRESKRMFVVISGEHIEGKIESGFIAIQDQEYEIKENDVQRVISQARNRSISPEKEIIFIHPNSYIVDEQSGIKEPVGIIGMKLEVEAFILKAKKTMLKTVERCIKRAGFEVEGYIFQPIASSFAVLDEEEKNQGCAVVDIGKGTTDIAVWYDSGFMYASSIKVGGNFIVNDLAIGLRTQREKAEEILKKFCIGTKKYAEGLLPVIISGLGGRPSKTVEAGRVGEIVESRLEEIIHFAKMEAMKSNFIDKLSAGVVLTGGYANLKGIEEIAEQIFGLPAIVKAPIDISGLKEAVQNPAYAACVGALKLGFHQREQIYGNWTRKKKSIFRKIWNFLKENI